MTIVPGQTPCLRCIFEEPPEEGGMPTANTHGIIGPIVTTIASLQVTETLKIASGRMDALRKGMLTLDMKNRHTADGDKK